MRLLAIHAHPDDESSKGAATCARYAAEGHRVMVLTCTGGERGEVLNPAVADRIERYPPRSGSSPEADMARMAELRRAEMAEAAAILGVEHRWLGFVDSGMPADPRMPVPAGSFAAAPPDRVVEAMVDVVRQFRPHVIVTYDENGGYPHPDHLATHRGAVRAFYAAADPAAFPRSGRPWRTSKLYYTHLVTKDRLAAFHEAMLHHGLESPLADWLAGWDDAGNRPVSARIRCERYYATRNRALLAHASQVDPASEWFSVPLELQQEAWPTEDFELAIDLTGSAPDGVEDCLFARITDAGDISGGLPGSGVHSCALAGTPDPNLDRAAERGAALRPALHTPTDLPTNAPRPSYR